MFGFCTVCLKPLPTDVSVPLAEHVVREDCAADYVESAHFVCGQFDNIERGTDYWSL